MAHRPLGAAAALSPRAHAALSGDSVVNARPRAASTDRSGGARRCMSARVVVADPRAARGLACRRHVPGRRHGAITALLSRSTHGTPVPARYGPHGRLQPRRPAPRGRRPDGFFPHRPQVQRYGSSAIRDLQLARSPACVHGTRTCRTRLDLRQVVVGPGREGDSVVAAGTRACRHGGHEMSAP